MALCLTARAQEKEFSMSGYIQVQNQWGGADAGLKVGAPNDTDEAFNRLGIRRGRVKLTYKTGLSSAVFQLDVTDKGVGMKDAYLNIRDPWIGTMSLQAGIFNRPFGYETGYSAAERESPERSAVSEALFANEQDLGAMLVLQAPSTSPWSLLKLEAGLFSGGGIAQEKDNKRDFIGHLSLSKNWNRAGFGAGISYYNGEALVISENAYSAREYLGFDARFTFDSGLGLTKLTSEYLSGEQPGLGDFDGGYAMGVQYLGGTPLALVAKYDWFAPEAADRREAVGLGALINLNPGIRLTAYYEIVQNEGVDLDDDLFTLRLQYKF